MNEYHVEIHGEAVLTVEYDGTPITIHLTFPSGDRTTFEYLGTVGKRVATAKQSSGAVYTPPPRHKMTSSGLPVPGSPVSLPPARMVRGANTLDYIDPGGSSMP